MPSHQAPAPGFSSWVVGAAVGPPIACMLAHSCPPSSSLASLALPRDPLKILTCALRSAPFAFRSGFCRLACASSAGIADGIRLSRRQRAQAAEGGDLGARLPWAVCVRWRVCAAGGCAACVWVLGTHTPASCEWPSSLMSWRCCALLWSVVGRMLGSLCACLSSDCSALRRCTERG